jgi:hypothetical protein
MRIGWTSAQRCGSRWLESRGEGYRAARLHRPGAPQRWSFRGAAPLLHQDALAAHEASHRKLDKSCTGLSTTPKQKIPRKFANFGNTFLYLLGKAPA